MGSENDTGSGAAPAADTNEAGAGARIRSTISFPYGSLKDAEQIADALHKTWGGATSPEQLAGGMNQTPTSGAFRNKTAAARIFGLTRSARGQISLTNLGRQIVDPQTRADARVKAFLHVPLFSKLHEEYKTSNLPPDGGLEQTILGLGVSKKQTSKARQMFQRSAEQAGFFRQQPGRLVKPPTNLSDSDAVEEAEKGGPLNRPATTSGVMPEAVQASILTLLQEGGSWSAEKTHEFVEATRKLNELLAPKRAD
jgi:hypothetical protein